MVNRAKPIPINPNKFKKKNENENMQKVEIKFANSEKFGFTELEKFVTHQNIDRNIDVNGKQ